MSEPPNFASGFDTIQEAIQIATRQIATVVNRSDMSIAEYSAIKSTCQGLVETVIGVTTQVAQEEVEKHAGQTGTGDIHEQGDELFWRPKSSPEDTSKNGTD